MKLSSLIIGVILFTLTLIMLISPQWFKITWTESTASSMAYIFTVIGAVAGACFILEGLFSKA